MALVMIARNEARCIRRSLLSAKNFVDRMVVLDTGSTDDTVAIATDCGADVHHFEWTGDFSAARNIALDIANADWNLVLDADEWIKDGGEDLQEIKNSRPSIGVVLVISESGTNAQRSENNSWISRLLPRGVHYTGRVHEQPISDLPKVRVPLVLGHDGYSASQLAIKRGRNRPLLLQELRQSPNDPYILYQIGKDHEVYDEFSTACDYYLQAADVLTSTPPYRHELFTRLLYCLSKSGRLEQAIAIAGEMMDEWPKSPDFFFTVGNLFLDWAILHPEQALQQWLPLAEAAWLRCLDIGERPELEGSTIGRGSFLAAHNLAVIYQGQNESQKAERYFQLAESLRNKS